MDNDGGFDADVDDTLSMERTEPRFVTVSLLTEFP
jgi:hypothetical protein